ncbi:MAG TPA: PKD domain-containing protein [Solirubrobacterales bacterium]|jgi:YVTN family beta-propeller protein|nr:PKD domain-containing protein [Solirubrobacterales bacterium]
MGGIKRILRYSVVFVAIAALFASVAAASAGAAPLAFVAEHGSDAVSMIDTGTNQVVGGPIAVGEGPASVAITPDGGYVFVADNSGDSVSVIETGLRRTVGEPIPVGEGPYGLAITPDGKYAFVTDRDANEVSVIDTQTRKVVAEIEVGAQPTGVAISPNGAYAYVADFGAETVQTINTETMKVVGTPINVGEGPMGIEFTPNGKTAYVVNETGKKVSAIDTATRAVTSIPLAAESRGIAITPDGSKAFVVSPSGGLVSEINTATNRVTDEIEVGASPEEVAISPNGETVYVTEFSPPQIQRIDVESGAVVGSPIGLPGVEPGGIAITPDQSPTAVFTPPSVTATFPATFDGSPSTDPDGGLISSYDWSFGDGATATGPSVSHTYGLPGTYNAKLSVVDDEGCGEAEVFTGRTAYCSGNPGASVQHQVTVASAPVVCSAKFGVRRLLHNRKNGTVRLQVKLRSAGFLLLFGKKVHAVTRKVKKAGPMWLTVHARVELNKRLKRTHHARVRTRITFTPNAGCGYKTVHRSFALLRRKKHHR